MQKLGLTSVFDAATQSSMTETQETSESSQGSAGNHVADRAEEETDGASPARVLAESSPEKADEWVCYK